MDQPTHEALLQVVSLDGRHVCIEARAEGVPVVLLHPNNATARSWIELGWFDALSALGMRPVAVDARGFGQSDDITAAEQLWPGTSSHDVAAVLDALDIERALLCGFSLGAAAALRFAVDQPGRVGALVIGGLNAGPLVQMGLHLASITADEARRRALAQLDRVKPTTPRAAEYFHAVGTVIATAPLRPLTGADLTCDVLAVAGELDPHDPIPLYEELRQGGANVRVDVVPQVGHGACFTHAAFREAALEFLAAHVASLTTQD